MNVKSRYCVVTLIVMYLVSLFLINPSILVKADTTNTSLKLICKTDEVTLSGMDWKLYKVSSTKKDDIYQLEGDFEDYRVSLKDLSTTSTMLDVANTLENYAILDKITPINYGTTDNDGIVSFADLEVGLYLLSGKSVIIDNKKYIPSAMLIEVVEDNETEFQLTTYPKFTVNTLSNDEVSYTVRKVWLNDEDDIVNRPKDIVIELYKNEELEDTIHLNDENDWKYSWKSTNAFDWRVKEVVIPDDYMVIYRNDEIEYLVVNIHDTTDLVDSHNNSNSNTHKDTLTTDTTTDVTTDITTNTNINTTITTSNIDTVTTIANNTETNTNTIVSNKDVSTVSNSKNTPGSSETIDKLPQTGQLWFPVPILMLSGIVLISVGLQLKSKK